VDLPVFPVFTLILTSFFFAYIYHLLFLCAFPQAFILWLYLAAISVPYPHHIDILNFLE